MRHCEIAVVGLGLMGSSALYALSRRGADVVGFDPLTVGAARGSSHGSCRIYRRFNFEIPCSSAGIYRSASSSPLTQLSQVVEEGKSFHAPDDQSAPWLRGNARFTVPAGRARSPKAMAASMGV